MTAAGHHDPNGGRGRVPSLGLGHSARFGRDAGVRRLVLGQLLVFAISLQDDEVVAAVVQAAHLPERLLFPLEIVFNLLLFVAWGCLTLGWVRLVRRLRRETEEKP